MVSAVHIGLWMHSFGDYSTGRFLNEERTGVEGKRKLVEAKGDCSMVLGGGRKCYPVDGLWSTPPTAAEVDAAAVEGGYTPQFCEDHIDWWRRNSPLATYNRFCQGGFVGGVCPDENCLDYDDLDLLAEVGLDGAAGQIMSLINENHILTPPEQMAQVAHDVGFEVPAASFEDAEGIPAPAVLTQANGGSAIANFEAGVNGDPLFIGIRGQVFKFDGEDDKWYANLATESVQWNLRFNEFDTCPANENMFVTESSVLLRDSKNRITVQVLDKTQVSPGCAHETVCLGEGSLGLKINDMVIRSPGEYELANNAGRVVIHNTYASCSRKWYDYVVGSKDNVRSGANRALIHNDYQETAMDLLFKNRGDMLDPLECRSWLEKRAENGDLFTQNGSWTTVHIETNNISIHMEYRQADRQAGDECKYHLIDAWISKVSPKILDQDWKGVLGETRYPKYDSDGKEIDKDRKALLVGQKDKDYEVKGPYATEFKVRDILSVHSSVATA